MGGSDEKRRGKKHASGRRREVIDAFEKKKGKRVIKKKLELSQPCHRHFFWVGVGGKKDGSDWMVDGGEALFWREALVGVGESLDFGKLGDN